MVRTKSDRSLIALHSRPAQPRKSRRRSFEEGDETVRRKRLRESDALAPAGRRPGKCPGAGQYWAVVHHGRGVTQDYGEAMRWYRKAADQQDALAQYNIGLLYAKGWGVPQDLKEARAWMQKAAAGGEEDARKWLAAN